MHTGCFAWAMIPNHAHLLQRIGVTPIATVTIRLLAGYDWKGLKVLETYDLRLYVGIKSEKILLFVMTRKRQLGFLRMKHKIEESPYFNNVLRLRHPSCGFA